jgi:N-hydroxyarylamine O-acetyltransferase
MNKMEIEKYLERINYKGIVEPTTELLSALQKLHLLSIPFENLDIHYKIPIELNLTNIFEKVINKRRGGFCYELNGLFYELLRSIGFDVKMISARVFDNKQQILTPEFDHLTIIAKINSADYLVDVGFGEFAFRPLKIELNKIQDDERGSFRLEKYDDDYYKVSKPVNENWMTEYVFSLKERDLSDFTEMCHYNQTSPLSHFTQNKLCSLASEKGRITVTGDKIKIKEGDTLTELPINSEQEFLSALEKYFNIRLHDIIPSQQVSLT